MPVFRGLGRQQWKQVQRQRQQSVSLGTTDIVAPLATSYGTGGRIVRGRNVAVTHRRAAWHVDRYQRLIVAVPEDAGSDVFVSAGVYAGETGSALVSADINTGGRADAPAVVSSLVRPDVSLSDADAFAGVSAFANTTAANDVAVSAGVYVAAVTTSLVRADINTGGRADAPAVARATVRPDINIAGRADAPAVARATVRPDITTSSRTDAPPVTTSLVRPDINTGARSDAPAVARATVRADVSLSDADAFLGVTPFANTAGTNDVAVSAGVYVAAVTTSLVRADFTTTARTDAPAVARATVRADINTGARTDAPAVLLAGATITATTTSRAYVGVYGTAVTQPATPALTPPFRAHITSTTETVTHGNTPRTLTTAATETRTLT